MKMQSAKVAFMRFSSQDVIATSGEGSLTAYTSWDIQLYDGTSYRKVDHLVANGSQVTLTNSNPEITLQIIGAWTGYNHFYFLDDCTKSGSDYTLNVTGAGETEPSGDGYFKLDSETAIIDWIVKHAKGVR